MAAGAVYIRDRVFADDSAHLELLTAVFGTSLGTNYFTDAATPPVPLDAAAVFLPGVLYVFIECSSSPTAQAWLNTAGNKQVMADWVAGKSLFLLLLTLPAGGKLFINFPSTSAQILWDYTMGDINYKLETTPLSVISVVVCTPIQSCLTLSRAGRGADIPFSSKVLS